MGKYAGKINTDVYGTQLNEMKIVHIALTAAQAAAADPDGLIDGVALGTGATTVTTFANQPPYPRNATIVASDTQTGDAVVTGTNICDDVISETLTINGTTPVVGALAFKTFTSIALPAKAGSETVDVGWGDKLGMPFMLTKNTLLYAFLNNTKEGTAATVVADSDEIEKNTVDLNSSLDGHVVDLYFLV